MFELGGDFSTAQNKGSLLSVRRYCRAFGKEETTG